MDNKKDFAEHLEDYIKEYPEVYDRFTFDNLFRVLLNECFEPGDAFKFILNNCSLSAIIFEERIYNKYYLSISVEDAISADLIDLRNQYLFEIVANEFVDLERDIVLAIKLIRKCAPKSLSEWEEHYYKKGYPQEHMENLGRRLYIKITDVCQAEIESIEEQDCIGFIINLVINRTYDGYQSEIQTIYGQLQNILGIQIKPAPDEWDRLYNVDFFIEINGKYIGLQIKPTTFKHTFEDYKWKEMQETSHRKFQEKFGGKVFTVFSIKEGKNKVIHNPEVIEEIRKEIERLEKE